MVSYGWHSGEFNAKSVIIGNKDGTGVVDSVNGKRLFQAYMISNAVGGDQRAAYIKLESKGANSAVSGEAIRAYHVCSSGVKGPVHGLHAGLSFSGTAYCNNEAVAIRGTVELPDAAITAGNYHGLQSEFYTNGSSAALNGSAYASFIRCIVTGSEATAGATMDTEQFLFDFSNSSGTNYLTAGSGKFIDTDKTSGTHSGGIRIKLPGGTTAWLAVVSA